MVINLLRMQHTQVPGTLYATNTAINNPTVQEDLRLLKVQLYYYIATPGLLVS